MGKPTASPGNHGMPKKPGFVDRWRAPSQRRNIVRRWKVGFKRHHRKLYKILQYAGIVLLIWVIFVAPWPLFR